MNHADLLALSFPAAIDAQGMSIQAELVAEGRALDAAMRFADMILLEADPATAALMLTSWERVYGLPSRCMAASAATLTMVQRVTNLLNVMTLRGGASADFMISLAAKLGYVITISVFVPFNTELTTEDAVTDEQYQFVFKVNAGVTTVVNLTSEDDTEMPTAIWGNDMLECVVNQFKPAHTHALFSYS